MTEISTSHTTAKIKLNVVEVGKDRTFIELPEGSAGAALIAALKAGGSKKVTTNGTEVKEDTPLADGQTVCVGPKSVKQGS